MSSYLYVMVKLQAGFTLLSFLICVSISAQFTEVASDVGINFMPNVSNYMGGGCAWFDYNNDGWEDLYVTGGLDGDKLYRNNGAGLFQDVTEGSGIELTVTKNTMGVSAGDFDNDGDQDLWVICWRSTISPELTSSMLFRNEGNGLFFDVAEDAGITQTAFSVSGGMMDLNGDGWLDLYSGNYVASPQFIQEDGVVVGFNHDCYEDWIYINNQDGTFTEISADSGIWNEGCTLALAGTDYDRDGDTDLMIANDFGEWVIPNKLYRNEGPDVDWLDVSDDAVANQAIYGMGVAVGDYDEDLDLDYYMTNLGHNILLNQDNGVFSEVAIEEGVSNGIDNEILNTGWGTFFFDADNDSYLDLFVCNGHIPTIEFLENHVYDPNKLYAYDGTGFQDVTEAMGVGDTLIGRGCAYADYDKDGDLDFAVLNIPNNVTSPPDQNFRLYRNDSDAGSWIVITLEGTTCNPNAFGAQVELYADGRTFLREISGGTSHASQNSNLLHFGLGEISAVDSAQIMWPGGDLQIVYPEIETYNHYIEGEIITSLPAEDVSFHVYPNPANSYITLASVESTRAKVDLIDARGRSISTLFIGQLNHQQTFSIPSHVANGLYFLQISGEEITHLPLNIRR